MIVGHKKQIEFLKKILNCRKIPHAILFSGKEKIGKKKVALEFASWILKKNPFSHPDFVFIEPKGNFIQIDQIRDLIWKIYLRPSLAKKKVAIIDDAHLMTIEAQNCFLKTLEEPPKDSIILLISSLPDLLLPTILSRCQKIKFYPPKKKEIEEFLRERGVESKEREKILKICKGKIGLAIEILENREKLEEMENAIVKFPKISLFERFEFLKNLKEKEIFLQFLFSHFEEKLFDEKERKRAISILKFLQIFSLKVDKKMAFEILATRI